MSRSPVSTSTPLGRDEDSTLGDFLEDAAPARPEEKISFEALRDRLRTVLDTLSLREREVIKMRFGIDYETTFTLDEIGKHFELTRERIRQIEKRSLEKLEASEVGVILKSFLE
jgi:RNA polymerase primary sigma factor